mgnify:CR=1 FL=1
MTVEKNLKKEIEKLNLLLNDLSNSDKIDVRVELVLNPNCPIEILEKLSDDKSFYILQYVANNPNCTVQLLNKITDISIQYNVGYISNNVLYNPKSTFYILKKIYKHFKNESSIINLDYLLSIHPNWKLKDFE